MKNSRGKSIPPPAVSNAAAPSILGIHAFSASLSLLLETGMDNIEVLVIEKSEHLEHLKEAIA